MVGSRGARASCAGSPGSDLSFGYQLVPTTVTTDQGLLLLTPRCSACRITLAATILVSLPAICSKYWATCLSIRRYDCGQRRRNGHSPCSRLDGSGWMDQLHLPDLS